MRKGNDLGLTKHQAWILSRCGPSSGPGRSADRSDQSRVRPARIPDATSGSSRVARNARARRVEGAEASDTARQRHRRADDAAAPQSRSRWDHTADSHRSWCRIRVAGRRTVSWWKTASIRVRLTAWYTAALALMLVVYATAVFVAVRHEFREELEAEEPQQIEHESSLTAEQRMDAQLREILVVLVLGLPVVVGLAGVGGYVLARRALEPIDHLGSEARRITAQPLPPP